MGRPMSWGVIIAILVADAIATGLFMGLVGTQVPLPPGVATLAVGANVGVVAAILISRRRAQLAALERGAP